MGRRKKPEKRLQIGALYFVDRRIKTIQILRRVLSRQRSINYSFENVCVFSVKKAPENNVVTVASHENFFGKNYSKIMIGNSQDFMIGYILVSELEKIVQGKLKWIVVSED